MMEGPKRFHRIEETIDKVNLEKSMIEYGEPHDMVLLKPTKEDFLAKYQSLDNTIKY